MAVMVVPNDAKLTMISSVSGSDLNVILLSNTISAFSPTELILKSMNNYYTAGEIVGAVSSFEASGTNYTPGGVALSGVSAFQPGAGDPIAYFNGSAVIWNNVSVQACGMAVYRTGTGLVVYIAKFSDPLPKEAVNGPFSVSWTNDNLMQMIG